VRYIRTKYYNKIDYLQLELFHECLQKRSEKYTDEDHYQYQPNEEYHFDKELPLDSYRIPHKIYFRKDYKG
jgi:hypothetical protein